MSIERLDADLFSVDGDILPAADMPSDIEPYKIPDNHSIIAGIARRRARIKSEQTVDGQLPSEEIESEDPAALAYWDMYDRIEKSSGYRLTAGDIHAKVRSEGFELPSEKPSTPQVMSAEAIHAAEVEAKLQEAAKILDPKERKEAENLILAHERTRREHKNDPAAPISYRPRYS